jgi:S-(hydroxymethyl)glutathione dehydrogenase/alcohol dehydrogenase
MKAAVFHAPNQPLTIEDIDIARPGRREVLIRTAATGLCHSDLHFIEGKYPGPVPAVLGHECSGVVEAVGEDVSYVQARRPRHHLPVGVLRPLRVLPVGHMSICNTPS